MRTRSRIAALCAIALLGAAPARAYFEETVVGARGVALGAAALGTISDASSYYWNPAALSALAGPEVMFDYAKPFSVPDLNVGSLAFAGRAYGTGWAAAWHRLSIANAYSEDVFYLAAGRSVMEWSGGHVLAAGLTYKLARLGFQPFTDPGSGAGLDFGAQTKGSVDAGVKWTTPWNVDFAWVGRDLLQPRYQLVAGTGGDLRKAHSELAMAVRWNRESTITLGWSQQDSGPPSFSTGIEILFFEVFAIRSGIANVSNIYEAYASPNDLQYNGGFGVFHHGYYVDAAATANHDLGASYRVTVRVPLGRRSER